MSEQPDRLSSEEIRALGDLLRRYCSYELDQWELLRVPTPHGQAYIELSRNRPDGRSADVYVDLDAWLEEHP